MKLTSGILLAAALAANAQTPQSLEKRIGHADPAKRTASRSHGSVGDMKCQTLMPRNAIPLLNFVHSCEMTAPQGGVGHHFHNQVEEMFVIFDGEAEFTIDGRTSLLKAPVGAPVRMGHSHAILNPTGKGIEFMNINVASVSGQYDAFDLADPRVGAQKDPVPVFMAMHLDKALMNRRSSQANYRGGTGTVQYRRALDPTVFLTNWSYVDHLIIPPGASEGMHRHPHLGEVYYVMNGAGQVKVGSETASIRKSDAVPVQPGEAHSLINNGTQELELMIIGVATEKGKLETENVSGQ